MSAWSWAEDAACAGLPLDMFFPPSGGSSAPAQQVCRRCPVRVECLQAAMASEVITYRFGIYGGLTAHGRRELARRAAA